MLAGDVLLSFLCDHYFCDDDHFMNETLIIKFIILREVLVWFMSIKNQYFLKTFQPSSLFFFLIRIDTKKSISRELRRQKKRVLKESKLCTKIFCQIAVFRHNNNVCIIIINAFLLLMTLHFWDTHYLDVAHCTFKMSASPLVEKRLRIECHHEKSMSDNRNAKDVEGIL